MLSWFRLFPTLNVDSPFIYASGCVSGSNSREVYTPWRWVTPISVWIGNTPNKEERDTASTLLSVAGFPKCEVSQLHAPALPFCDGLWPFNHEPQYILLHLYISFLFPCCCLAFVKFSFLTQQQQQNNEYRLVSIHKANLSSALSLYWHVASQFLLSRMKRKQASCLVINPPAIHKVLSISILGKTSSEAAMLRSSSVLVSMAICG